MHLFNRLPFGLAMVLMDNPQASCYFSSLPPAQQKEIMSRAHEMQTQKEIEEYIQSLCRRP